MDQATYIARVARLRRGGDLAIASVDRLVSNALLRAYNDLGRILRLKGKDTLTHSFLSARRAAIGEAFNQLGVDLRTAVRLTALDASEQIAQLYSRIVSEFAPELSDAFERAFTTVPVQATRNVIGRVWSDGFNFSDRVWRITYTGRAAVNEIVAAGIARGESAVDMSKKLRTYLVDPALTEGQTWTTGVTKSVTGRGTIHYSALRLARTEINNAYRESLVELNHRNPVVAGVKWNLSGSHPSPDICDVWAEADEYGMGPGVYPARATPIDHPNGLCFLTEAVRPASEWRQAKPEPRARPLSREQIGKLLKAKGATKTWQTNAAVAMHSNVAKTIEQFRKAA